MYAPTWGATCRHRKSPDVHQSFNPRPHMGDDLHRVREKRHVVVSIHAPTWGAKEPTRGSRNGIPVSIHAPTWGDDKSCCTASSTFCLFQSTPPTWGTTFVVGLRVVKFVVSIHAPTWGTTVNSRTFMPAILAFQSTPPHGGRLFRNNTNIHKVLSQCFCESYINNVYTHSLL